MKTQTDLHWDNQSKNKDIAVVNIVDIYQREVEHCYIKDYLCFDSDVLEVGCGNGYSTVFFSDFVKHIDAFDYSENMIYSAKKLVQKENIRFFVDNILEPKNIEKKYDVVICVRVLINLDSFSQQAKAIENMASFLKKGGKLILVEGFKEGFYELSRLRDELGLPLLKASAINFYSSYGELRFIIEQYFEICDNFHLGMYDFMTRIVYPLIKGQENVQHNTDFSNKSELLAKMYNPDAFEHFSRVKGIYALKK